MSVAATVMAILPSWGQAAVSIESHAYVLASNTGNYPYAIGDADSSSTGSAVSAAMTNWIFDNNMVFSGSASASASFGRLHTAASGSVTDALHDPGNPFLDENGDQIPGGVPGHLLASGNTAFHDTLTYSNTFGAVKVNFFYHITGSFTGTNVHHNLHVDFGGQTDFITLDAPGSMGTTIIGQTWATRMFDIIPGQPMQKSVRDETWFALETEFENGGDFAGSANFSNTVTLTGMSLYDENDNLITGWSVTSGSGTIYPVPEPSGTLLLGLTGTLALLRGRRRA